MHAITGITGNVGGALARALLARREPVRAVVRDARKGRTWAARGGEVAVADMGDATALTAAFTGARTIFVLPPSEFDPAPGYPEARRVIEAVLRALEAARPAKVVCLSTIGADAAQDNLLSQRTLLEEALRTLDMPVAFLRPAWFLENASWDVASARDEGVVRSFLAPLDKRFPMVATRDVGLVAAELLCEAWEATRVVELEGPARVSPHDLAAAFAAAVGRPVRAEAVPHEEWEPLFRAQGMRNPDPRIRMLDGFNEGWIEFARGGADARKGRTTAEEVVANLVRRTPAARAAV